jgi:hypothetical protein
MSHRWSRLLSAATASYGVYALVEPAHLWKALEADRGDRDGLELLAQTFGVRDLAISAVALTGRSDRVVRAAMLLRIAMDLGDAALLSARVDPSVRTKVLAVTLGWASLNTAALVADSRSE